MGEHTSFWPDAPELRRADITFNYEGVDYLGHLVAPEEAFGPRPLVLVIHNYQGLKFFDVDVAEYLARVGYVGLAIDTYGTRCPPEQREFPADPAQIADFQQRCFAAMVAMDHDWALFRGLLARWLQAGLEHDSVDATARPSAIGYCFGGVAVLEAVRGGLDLATAVSFHGLLQTGEDPNPEKFGAQRPALKPVPNTYRSDTVVLIENGAEDGLVPLESRTRFFAEMDEAGVDWIFHHHAQTPHGFALPPTLGPPGRLYTPADRRSTVSMLSLFREVYPQVEQNKVAHNAAGTAIP